MYPGRYHSDLLDYARTVDCNKIVTIEAKKGQIEPNETKNRNSFISQFNQLILQDKLSFT